MTFILLNFITCENANTNMCLTKGKVHTFFHVLCNLSPLYRFGLFMHYQRQKSRETSLRARAKLYQYPISVSNCLLEYNNKYNLLQNIWITVWHIRIGLEQHQVMSVDIWGDCTSSFVYIARINKNTQRNSCSGKKKKLFNNKLHGNYCQLHFLCLYTHKNICLLEIAYN